jgi:hypothetical protein
LGLNLRKVHLFVYLLLIFLLSVYFLIFNKKKSTYTFYHWQQKYQVQSTNTPKYIKILDISYENKTTIYQTKFTTIPTKKIVPVIYLDNPVLKHEKAKEFAQTIINVLKINKLNYNEIQIDCDWTEDTKENYFNFLKELKKLSNKRLSATIRLHQVKYCKRTSVPPVEKGVLMYYNMSNFKDLKTKNYILDLELAKKYHYNFDTYPLPLNLALPLYAQATLIRFKEVVGIIEGLRKKDLNTNFKALKENHYLVTKTHYLKGRLLYKDDILRLDAVNIEDLKHAVKNLKEVMNQPEEIIFYRWGHRAFYNEKDLENIANW